MGSKATSTVLKELVAAARAAGRSHLTEREAKAVFAEAGIATTMPRLATSAEEAVRLAREMAFPVVVKVDSPDIVHKSAVGGVRLNLRSEEEVGRAYSEMLASVREHVPTATLLGVTVQPMAPQGAEVVVGAAKDPQFGPVIMFGLGGVLVEVLQDISFRVVPIDRRDAHEMIRELRGYRLLVEGHRGAGPADLEALEELLLMVSGLVSTNPVIRDLDLNPVLAYRHGAVAVDARIALEAEET